jgi:hypothetical protein
VVAVEMKEEIMKLYSLTELFNLSRAELFALHRETFVIFDSSPIGSDERETALANLGLIRRILAGPHHHPA